MITQKQQIVNYWIENLYPKHGMHEWDMGCDFSEATHWCWRCGIESSRLFPERSKNSKLTSSLRFSGITPFKPESDKFSESVFDIEKQSPQRSTSPMLQLSSSPL